MPVKSATFITSLTRYVSYEGMGLPEVCVVGKSNVGKSSLINRLTGRKKLAKTSGTPGKTRLINLFNIDGEFILVDLPGYGFARVPGTEKEKWAKMIEGYFSTSGSIKLALQLVDIRHSPTQDDVTMVNYLRHYGIPFFVVATKADKLSGAARGRNIPTICRALAVQPWQVLPFSSESGLNNEELLKLVSDALDVASAT